MANRFDLSTSCLQKIIIFEHELVWDQETGLSNHTIIGYKCVHSTGVPCLSGIIICNLSLASIHLQWELFMSKQHCSSLRNMTLVCRTLSMNYYHQLHSDTRSWLVNCCWEVDCISLLLITCQFQDGDKCFILTLIIEAQCFILLRHGYHGWPQVYRSQPRCFLYYKTHKKKKKIKKLKIKKKFKLNIKIFLKILKKKKLKKNFKRKNQKKIKKNI